MIKRKIATSILQILGRHTPALLRQLMHRIASDRNGWKILELLMKDSSFKKWLASVENPTITRRGFQIHTLEGDATSDFIKLFGQHETSTERFILDHLSEGGAFLDIGSNIGYFSLSAAWLRKCPVVAFEPQKSVAELLGKSIQHNLLTDLVRVENLALSDEETKMSMTCSPGNTGHAHLVASANAQDEVVSVLPLDRWLEAHPRQKISVCKIDTEGAEFKVLSGMQQMIERDGPALVIEIIENHLANFNCTSTQIFDFLEKNSYSNVSSKYADPGDLNCYFLRK